MITGKDERSLWALERLREGWKPAQLMNHGFTESQAKKLSQFYNCLCQLQQHCQPEHVEKWKELGLKGLVLLSMFKQEDWEGLMEALSSASPNIKRSEIAKLPDLIHEKRERLREVEQSVQRRIESLTQKKEELLKTIEQTEKERKALQQSLPGLAKEVDSETLDFLLDHLGIRNGKFCLAKRLDYRWQKNLRNKGVIHFSEKDYTHWVQDVQALAKDYQRRKKRGYRVFYSPEHVPASEWWEPPRHARYLNIYSLQELKGKKLTKEKERIQEIEEEIRNAEEELKQFRKRRPESFSESLKRSNQFASFDMEQHGALQALGLKWLHNRGYVATTELTLPGNQRVDVIGYNENGEICILECKASLEDYQRDNKWRKYLKFCDRFYFVAPPWITNWIDEEVRKEVGILKAHKTYLEVERECPSLEKAEQAQETAFMISRQLSRRYAFGY